MNRIIDNKISDEAEIRLNRAEAKFKMLFELSPIGMAMVSHDTGEFLEVNSSLLNATGYSKDEFLKLSFWDITPREYEEQEKEQIIELNETGKFGPNEKEYIRKDGSRYPIKISGFMLIDVDGSEVVWGMIEDISERKKMEEELKYNALHDSLTGLANRRLLTEMLDSSMAYSERENKIMAIFMIDLDKFKYVNDNYGHAIGDKVLIEVGRRINSLLNRKTDTVSRIGGDEFSVIASLLEDEKDARLLAKEICTSLSRAYIFSDIEINISASLGIAIYPHDGKNHDEIMTKADKACYEVKNRGGNSYMFFKDLFES